MNKLSSVRIPVAAIQLLIGAIALAEGPLVVNVNCDAGEDLGQAIREAEWLSAAAATCSVRFADQAGGVVQEEDSSHGVVCPETRPVLINVVGTCRGNFKVKDLEFTLRGAAEGAALQSLESPEDHCAGVYESTALCVTGDSEVRLEGLTIRGLNPAGECPDSGPLDFGLVAVGPSRVFGSGLRFESLWVGALSASGAFVEFWEDVFIDHVGFALATDDSRGWQSNGAVLHAYDVDVNYCYSAADVFGSHSLLALQRSRVASSSILTTVNVFAGARFSSARTTFDGTVGVWADSHSPASVRLLDSGAGSLVVHSALVELNGRDASVEDLSLIDSTVTLTSGARITGNISAIGSRIDLQSVVDGDIELSRASEGIFESFSVGGTVTLLRGSEATLLGPGNVGGVECDATSSALCEASVAFGSGACGPCSGDSTDHPAGTMAGGSVAPGEARQQALGLIDRVRQQREREDDREATPALD